MRSDLRSSSIATGSIWPERACIWPIMFSTGSDGNIRGMKKMNVTPMKIVRAHVNRRRPKYFQNFTGHTPPNIIFE